MQNPTGGEFSEFIDNLQEFDFEDQSPSTIELNKSLVKPNTMHILNICGNVKYLGRGNFSIFDQQSSQFVQKQVKKIGMITMGTGIAPMYQIMQAIH